MISNPCTRIDIGPPSQPMLICGERDDVIQVSITSGSPVNSAPPHAGQTSDAGLSTRGSTGKSASRARTASPHDEQNHTGNGTPYRRCLEMFQSDRKSVV